MRTIKVIALLAAAWIAMTASAEDSVPFRLDTRSDSVEESSIGVTWDAAWIGGDSGATVVIADNGSEVKRTTGSGELLYEPPAIGRHELTYTTYIDGIAQEEIYRAVVFTAALACNHITVNTDACVATCTEAGFTGDWVCEICGKVVEHGATIPALGHEPVETKAAKEATCMEAGWTHQVWCSHCNEVLEMSLPIAALGHSMDEGVMTKPPTIFDEGVKTYYCTRCSMMMQTEPIPKIAIAIDANGVLTSVNLNGATEVVMPDSVTSIGDSAFYQCAGLISLTIPNSVTNIGDWAFAGCEGLTSIVIPDNVASVGCGAFAGCCGLTNVVIKSKSLDCKRPGLIQSKFDVYNDLESSIVDSPTRADVSGVLMGYAYDEATATKTFSDPIYGGSYSWNATNTTFAYCGYMYMEAGREYVFGKYLDDSVRIVIDGMVVLNNTKYTAFATGKYVPAFTGWHEIDVRLADGKGEKGPRGGFSGTHPWGADMGVGWRDDGITNAVPESAWHKLMDPGDGSLFRCSGAQSMFAGCSNIVSATMPWSLISKTSSMFPDAYSELVSITLTGEIDAIPEKAFAGCAALRNIDIPAGVSKIGKDAFKNCAGLEELHIPGGKVIVEDGAFSGCDGIRSVVVPLDIARCGLIQSKFDVNNDLESSVIDSPTRADVSGVLMGYAYDEATATKTFSDPIYGGSYSWNATNTTFAYCGYMYMEAGREYVFGKYLDGSVRIVIDGMVVLNNTKYTDFATGKYVPYVTGWHAIDVRLADGKGQKGPKGGTSGTHPWGADMGVGWRDDGITNAVPESAWHKLMDPGDGSLFRVEAGLTLQNLLPDSYTKVTNIVFDANFGRVIPANFLAGCKSLTNVVVPSSIASIGERAFSGCSGLLSMAIPDSVVTVGPQAFRECTGMTNVTIGTGLRVLRSDMFYHCTGLTDVTVPNNVTNIERYVFSKCTNLKRLSLPFVGSRRGNTRTADSLFGHIFAASAVDGLTKVVQYYDSKNSITRYIPQSLTHVSITDETSIGYKAFAGCVDITSVDISKSVARIEDGAFAGCSSLTNMVLPFIGAARQCDLPLYTPQSSFGYIFGTSDSLGCEATAQQWTNSTSVTYYIPSSLASVEITDETETGVNAFRNCKNIQRVILNEGIQRIRGSTFDCCTSLRDVYIPKTTKQIVGTSFWGCTNLSSVTIPRSVSVINRKAFASDANLTTVMFEGNAPKMDPDVFLDVASSCTAYVSRKSTGWGVAIPGTWNGIRIEYLLMAPLASDATPESVTNAIELVGFADSMAVKAAIGGSVEKYSAFKEWAQSVKHPVASSSSSIAAGEDSVIANTNAAAAFVLGAERLFENAPKIEFGEVEVGRGEGPSGPEEENGTITLSVAVMDGENPEPVKVAVEKVKAMFEATSSLGDWEGDAKLTPTVEILEGDGNTLRFKVTPGDGTSDRAFLRIRK